MKDINKGYLNGYFELDKNVIESLIKEVLKN